MFDCVVCRQPEIVTQHCTSELKTFLTTLSICIFKIISNLKQYNNGPFIPSVVSNNVNNVLKKCNRKYFNG